MPFASFLPSRGMPRSPSSSLLDRRVELLGHFSERLHALWIVDVLSKDHFVRADAYDLSVVEQVARADEITLVVGRPDLGDVPGLRLPDPVDDEVVDRDSGDSRRPRDAAPVLLAHEERA